LLVDLRIMLFVRMYKRSGLVNKNSGHWYWAGLHWPPPRCSRLFCRAASRKKAKQ
jgi:hypothetical protein